MNIEKQKIYNKLFKSKKTDLREVKLSLIQEAQEHLDMSSDIDIMLDEFWEAVDVVRKADAYFYHEFRLDFSSAELIINELEENLRDLGLENPPELDNLKEQLEYQREKGNELAENLDWLKGQIGNYDKL